MTLAGDAARGDLAQALAFAGRPELAELELRKGEQDLRSRLALASALRMQGRRGEALRDLDEIPDVPAWLRHLRRAHLLVGDGDVDAVRRERDVLLEVDAESAVSLAVHLAYAGDVEGAERLKQGLPAGSAGPALVDALVAWRRGDPSDAATQLRAIAGRPRPSDWQVPIDAVWFLLGEALLDSGDAEGALAAIQHYRAQYFPLAAWRAWTQPRSELVLARALARSDRIDEALSHLERLLVAMRNGDRGLPLAREARALRTSLLRSRGAAPRGRDLSPTLSR